MNLYRGFLPLVVLLTFAGSGNADTPKPSSLPPITKQTREDLIRSFNSELVYIRSPFPMGKKGLMLKDGQLTPAPDELKTLISMWGPAVKPGDQARITGILIKSDRIHFEINGGPVKKVKWYQRIQVSGAQGDVPMAPSDSNANPRGSYVDLAFDRFVPELSPQQLKDLLRPVFDFDSHSPVDAYLETVPPKVKDAIKAHHVLVGMNRDMVLYAKGHPPKKEREKDGDVEYEEWIYGDPPEDVDFVRFVGDEVVRVETMKVGGEKLVRTEKEVIVDSQTDVAKQQPAERPANAPSLRRPGEDVPIPNPTVSPSGPAIPMPPPAQDPGPPAAGPN